MYIYMCIYTHLYNTKHVSHTYMILSQWHVVCLTYLYHTITHVYLTYLYHTNTHAPVIVSYKLIAEGL